VTDCQDEAAALCALQTSTLHESVVTGSRGQGVISEWLEGTEREHENWKIPPRDLSVRACPRGSQAPQVGSPATPHFSVPVWVPPPFHHMQFAGLHSGKGLMNTAPFRTSRISRNSPERGICSFQRSAFSTLSRRPLHSPFFRIRIRFLTPICGAKSALQPWRKAGCSRVLPGPPRPAGLGLAGPTAEIAARGNPRRPPGTTQALNP
jgi:hypothetical protein